jgi:hypothetical protein
VATATLSGSVAAPTLPSPQPPLLVLAQDADGLLQNNFIAALAPGHPFLTLALQTIIARAEEDTNVVSATGPAMLTALFTAFQRVPLRPSHSQAPGCSPVELQPDARELISAVATASVPARQVLPPPLPLGAPELTNRERFVPVEGASEVLEVDALKAAWQALELSVPQGSITSDSPQALALAVAAGAIPGFTPPAASAAAAAAAATAAAAAAATAAAPAAFAVTTYGDTVFLVGSSALYPTHWRDLGSRAAPSVTPPQAPPELTRADSAEALSAVVAYVEAMRGEARCAALRLSPRENEAVVAAENDPDPDYAPSALEAIVHGLNAVHTVAAACTPDAVLLGSHAWDCTWGQKGGSSY